MNRVERLIRNADLALYRLTHAAAAAVATHKTHKEKTPSSFSVCVYHKREGSKEYIKRRRRRRQHRRRGDKDESKKKKMISRCLCASAAGYL